MKILIAADMEGVTGVVHWDHVSPSHTEYPRFRHLMTGDVNAAIRGAFEAGADEVAVTDGHAGGCNILIEELDPRARLNAGEPVPLAMVQGVDAEVNGVIFVGYHARVGTPDAILDHTWSSRRVAGLWLNGQPMGEIGLNAAVCGHFDVPVIMVSGDQSACAEATELLGSIETAVVKHAGGRMAAECLPPEVTHAAIYSAAVQAVSCLRADEAPPPFRIQTPVSIAIELACSEMADRAMILPGAHRREGKRVELTADDMLTAYRLFQVAVTLAGL
jgi:D-amino peptidase